MPFRPYREEEIVELFGRRASAGVKGLVFCSSSIMCCCDTGKAHPLSVLQFPYPEAAAVRTRCLGGVEVRRMY